MMDVRLGDLVELYAETCGIANLTVDDVSGINRDKEFFSPAKQVGTDTSKYKIVPPKHFACNLMHVGRDIVLPISLNTTDENKIVSPAYTVFKIKDESVLLNEYFFIWLKSDEKDRFFWLFTDSSVRDGLAWDDFCNIRLSLPPIDIQRKYAAVYQSLLANLHAYERGLDDLKQVCDGYIEHLRQSVPLVRIGGYLKEHKAKNINGKYSENDVMGIATGKSFIETKSNLNGVNLKNYAIVPSRHFAYVADTSRRGDKVSLAFNNSGKSYLVSSISTVFYSTDETRLLPEYLALFFQRAEFDCYARYHSWGSAREVFAWADLCDVKIPLPELAVQQAIADIYQVWIARRQIAERLKQQINRICPVLVRGAIQDKSAVGF
ncbi:TPA: restriction endonuclease subunit S [Neisseria subflava]